MKFRRILSVLLSTAVLLTAFPFAAFADSTPESYSLSNGYIKADVSTENGGFIVGTVEGNQLKKSDNNKWLLYHDGAYDTSFVSFRVSNGTQTKDYLFGGKYGGLSDVSRQGVTVTQAGGDNTDITAVWGVGDLEFTLTYGLANSSSNEHGMVSVAIKVKNNGTANYDIKARILYDTAFDDQDYGYYQLSDGTDSYLYQTEVVLDSVGAGSLPQNFFASDSKQDASVVAYVANGSGASPYQVAFGHWNNLASTLYDFAPDTTLDFSEYQNDYYTSDSAMALYYDLGSAASGEELDMTTFYGVYANSDITVDERISVNVTAPTRLEMNQDKTAFEVTGVGLTNLSVDVSFENYMQEGAKELSSIQMAVSCTSNLRPLDTSTGTALENYDFDTTDPLITTYTNVKVGEVNAKTINFQAKLTDSAAYERITIAFYDVSETDGQLSETNLIGRKVIYVLLPASDGSLPKVGFVAMSPNTIYKSGTRHLYLSLTNSAMLDNRSNWNLYAVSALTGEKVVIDHSGISITDNVMDVAIDSDVELATGTWQLQLEWTSQAVSSSIVESRYKEQTASCLLFAVSEDEKYKNECYGVVAIVRFGDEHSRKSDIIYRIKTFADEAAFAEYEKNAKTTKAAGDPDVYSQILLTFRGDFTVEQKCTDSSGNVYPTKLSAVSKKTVNSQTRKSEVTNRVTINDCLDFEDGTMTIYYDCGDVPRIDESIKVEFDGDLLTSIAGTSVWSGQAGFSEFEQGELYSLIEYDEDGERDEEFAGENIYLVWPTYADIGQTICGMIFNLAFGEMGYIADDDGEELGRVISFSANLDLSFTGSDTEGADPQQTYWYKLKNFWKTYRDGMCVFDYMDNSDYYDQLADMSNVDEGDDDDKKVSGSVMVSDILFGCGKGFYGVHFSVGVSIANYIESLPSIEGQLEVNTIGDWSFGLEGGVEMATFEMEAKLSFKSKDDIPIPDEVYFYIGGFEPGINIDGCGVVWITGGGGGIEDLYDTIMCTESVPPLKLIMTVSFSIVKILDGKATLELGLTGLSLSAEDIKIAETIEVLEEASLELEWYPGIDLKAAVKMNLYAGLIKGNGYIVVVGEAYKDWFFEFFVRASLMVPESIPIVGGMKIAGVDLGANSDKIWGAVEVLCTNLGITYYWGADGVDFGSGAAANPTYPELLGYEDVPVYYDEERDDTLYMRVGTNVSPLCEASVAGDGDMQLLAYPNAPYARSNSARTSHEFALGSYSGQDTIIQLSYDAADLADAKAKAQSFVIQESGSSAVYSPVYYSEALDNAATCNANVSYSNGKATLALSATSGSTLWDKVWTIDTGSVSCSLALYGVDMIPEVTYVIAYGKTSNTETTAGDYIDICWVGSNLKDLDSMEFFLCETNDPTDAGTRVELEAVTDYYSKTSASAKVPESVKSGQYYLKCVYVEDNTLNGVIYSTNKITVNNSLDPEAIVYTDPVSAGNLKIGSTVTVGANTDGVKVSVYNADGTLTDVHNVKVEAEGGVADVLVGGSYNYEGLTAGLTGGKTYYLELTPYNSLDTDGDGSDDTVLYGTTYKTASVVLNEVKTPVISVTAAQNAQSLSYTASSGTTYLRDTYTTDALDFTADVDNYSTASDKISGSWSLDGAASGSANYGTFTSQQSVAISLADVGDGDHTLKISGTNENGDTFRHQYVFTVDTEAPGLTLAAPLNGALYNTSGKIGIQLYTDADANVTVSFDGTTVAQDKASAIGTYENGILELDVSVPDPSNVIYRKLTVKVSDAAGNYSERSVNVYNGRLADIKSVTVLVDGNIISSGNIPVTDSSDVSCQLQLVGITSDGQYFVLDTLPNVLWTVSSVSGSASVDADGKLEIKAGSQGIVSGGLEITTGAYMTYTLTYGADYSWSQVEVLSSIGGTVSGAGHYNPGSVVTVTAAADSGYQFDGWTAEGITLADPSALTQTFTMPESGNVVLTASFSPVQKVEALVEISSSAGGTVSGAGYYNPGSVVTVTAAADSGYQFDGWTAEGITLADPSALTQTFTMPESGNVALTATFSPVYKTTKKKLTGRHVETAEIPSGSNSNTYVPCIAGKDGSVKVLPFSCVIDGKLTYFTDSSAVTYNRKNVTFTDIADHWSKDAIEFAAARGILSGYPDGTARPNGKMTRAMLVTVLYNLSGAPSVSAKSSFTDVDKTKWYASAVEWAYENGIVSGYGNGEFGPEDYVTREQMCVVLCKYASYESLELDPVRETTGFKDQAKIASYASAAVETCQQAAVVSGRTDGSFDPKSGASRGEFCCMIMNFITAALRSEL